jgi:hypothetical protein
MRHPCHSARRAGFRPPAFLLLTFACISLLPSSGLPSAAGLPRSGQSKLPAVRWNEETPGCTFSLGDDGKFHYGLWSGDIGITLAIDSQELEKVHRRHEPFFSVLLDVRYRGHAELDWATENISLEFVKHFHVVQTSLDPDTFTQKVQDDADTVDHEAAREVQKHPEKKLEKETYVRAFQKDSAELLEFVSKNSMRPTRLETGNPEVRGWVFFGVDGKWVGGWTKQEDLILRVPLDGKVFEFPFTLPPKPGEVMLRKRD